MVTNTALDALRASDARICAWLLDDGIADGDDPATNVRWHTIALEGKWNGHHMGPFRLARDHFEQIVSNFEALKIDAVVDYEHASMFGALSGAGKAPAAGWIDQMQIREGDGGAQLAARVRWTDTAAEHIRAREYRYLSPLIAFRTPDRATGQDLGASVPSVALTNTPFLEELPEVRLNSHPALAYLTRSPGTAPEHTEDQMDKEQQKALALALGLAGTASPEDIVKSVRDVAEDAAALTELARILHVDEGAPAGQLVVAARAITEQAAASVQLAPAELEQLRADAAAARALRAERAIEKAAAAGKIVASNRAWALALAEKDPAGFEAWEAAAPAIVPTREVKPPASPALRSLSARGNAEPTEDEIKALCARPEVQAAAKAGHISVDSYARYNFAALAEQYAA